MPNVKLMRVVFFTSNFMPTGRSVAATFTWAPLPWIFAMHLLNPSLSIALLLLTSLTCTMWKSTCFHCFSLTWCRCHTWHCALGCHSDYLQTAHLEESKRTTWSFQQPSPWSWAGFAIRRRGHLYIQYKKHYVLFQQPHNWTADSYSVIQYVKAF